ncbi:potassium channel family protein [Erysipelothrix aquatica]|uniref:potassium channel family protein n=1 Tax=Erysipelothrix aquatica TaxID=2683714 RepID=UPI00135785AD|nr:potassium channel family protein [Erysipelothrix aquatica]
MVSFLFLGFKQIWKIFANIGKRHETRAIIVLVLALLLTGTCFFTFYEGMLPLDALYFCFVTLMTIGYGDLVPVAALGKMFTMVYATLGVGIVGLLAGLFARECLSRTKFNVDSLD